MNCPEFELLSAHADGETTPEEATLVSQHCATCATCSQHLTNLGFVSRAVRQPQGLPAGFQIRLKPRPKTGWWQKLRELADSPVVHLVSAQRRRRARFGLAEMAKMMAVFALPVFFMSLSSDRSPLVAFLMVSAFGLMVGLPLRQFSEEVALLASLRRGRCLEEIVTAGTSPQDLLDGLALQGFLQVGKSALTVWPVLFLGTLALPSHWQGLTWELQLSWLLSLLGIFLAGYYAAQLFQVWPGNWIHRCTMLVLVLSPWTLLLCGLPGCLAASALTAMVARRLAIHGLRNPAVARAMPVSRRNPLVRCWSQNPIARREMGRLAGGLSGLPRLLAWRSSMAIAPIAWTLHSISKPLNEWPGVFFPGVLMFTALFFVRSAALTLPAVVREREQQSWEILMQTPLGPRSVIEGWLQVCLYSLYSEGLFALFVLAGYLFAAVPWQETLRPLASLLLLPLASVTGAYVGLALSSSSRNQREAGQKLILWSLSALLGWLVTWGLGLGAAPPPFSLLGPVSLWALIPVLLGLALKARPLFSRLPCIDPGEHETVHSRYSPALICLDLGSLLLLGYGLVAWDALSRQADLSAAKGATLLLTGGLIWLLGLRLPLATLAELSLGRRFSLLIGPMFGLWLGWSASLALAALSFKLRDPLLVSLESEYACLFLGLLMGVLSGALASRGALGSPTRRAQLRPRLAWTGSLSLAGMLALPAIKSNLEVPPNSPPVGAWSNASPYCSQLEVARYINLSDDELFLKDEKWDEFPSSDSSEAWLGFAQRHAQTPALERLRAELPPFGKAAPVPRPAGGPRHAMEKLQGALRAQAILYAGGGKLEAALNCDRWALLCLDDRDHWPSDHTVDLDDELDTDWVLDDLQARIGQGLVVPGLIEQLQSHEFASAWLRYSYTEVRYRGPVDVESLQGLLPGIYLAREQQAEDFCIGRAEKLAQELKLWDLSHDGGAGLLEGIRFTPLARRKIFQLTVSNGVRGLARSWSRREGLALLAAIQLYRRDHAQAWPDNLEQVQSYLPRPARCYLNEAGSFDYAPGVYLGCAREDGSQRIVIFQEAK